MENNESKNIIPKNMKIILTIVPFVLFSCRTFPHYPQVYNYVYDEEAYFKEKECSFNGKNILQRKRISTSSD